MEVALFGAALAVALYSAMASHAAGLVRTGSVLICNWLALLAVVKFTGRFDPVEWFLAVDFVSAVLVLWHPASRPQAAIGLIYMVQIGIHFARWPGGGAGTAEYLNLLALGGWLQIAILVLGAVDGTTRKAAVGHGGRSNAQPSVAAGAARMEARAE